MGTVVDAQKKKIEDCLGAFWDEMAIELGGDAEDTASLIEAPLDSLTAVEVLVAVDKIMNRKIPAETVIQKGGYNSREQFIEDLTAKILGFANENPEAAGNGA